MGLTPYELVFCGQVCHMLSILKYTWIKPDTAETYTTYNRLMANSKYKLLLAAEKP